MINSPIRHGINRGWPTWLDTLGEITDGNDRLGLYPNQARVTEWFEQGANGEGGCVTYFVGLYGDGRYHGEAAGHGHGDGEAARYYLNFGERS